MKLCTLFNTHDIITSGQPYSYCVSGDEVVSSVGHYSVLINQFPRLLLLLIPGDDDGEVVSVIVTYFDHHVRWWRWGTCERI